MSLAPVTAGQMLANARVFALRNAVVAAFAAHFVGFEVKSHIGKLDMSDVLEKDIFAAPAVAIAATRLIDEDRLGLIAARLLCEPYSRVLLYPWDELLVLIAEGQEIADDEAASAAVRLVEAMREL